MMKVMVIYDITNDKERSKIANICLDFGLERIQKSAFLGEIDKILRKQLIKELKGELTQKDFNLQVFELDKNSDKRRLIWQEKKNG